MLFFTVAILFCAVRDVQWKPANHFKIKFNLREYRKLKTTPVRYTYSPYKPHLHPLHLPQNVNKYFLTCINKEETSFSTVVVDFSDLVREFLY